jgi:hypothetical protein
MSMALLPATVRCAVRNNLNCSMWCIARLMARWSNPNHVIEILDRVSFNASLVALVYEPATRQLISNTMLSTRSLRPRVTRSDRTKATVWSLSTAGASAPVR